MPVRTPREKASRPVHIFWTSLPSLHERKNRRRPFGNRLFYEGAYDACYLSMVSMVRCVLVKTQMSAAMAMASFTISAGFMSVWRSSARAAESA